MNNANHSTANKVALVTGAARRVGASIAKSLHQAGYNLILHYHGSEQQAMEVQSELHDLRPDSVSLLKCDLRDIAKLKISIRESINQLGRLDLLVNNASAFFPTPLSNTNEDHFEKLFYVNVKAPYFLSQGVAPYLKKTAGSIINITDIYADRPLSGYSLYSATKAGLVSMTKSLAVELGPEIRVNAISPGAILWPENDSDEIAQQRIISQTPMKRHGSAQDIASTVVFLAESDFINGQVLAVDGGRSISMG